MAYQNITPEISDETVGQQVQGRKIGLSPIFKVYTFSPTVPSLPASFCPIAGEVEQ